MRLQYPSNIRMIKLPCTGKLEVIHLLKALEAGADGVYAAGCLEGECHYLKGNLWAKKRVGYVKKLLEEIGVDPGRVEMYNMSSAMGPQFAETARDFTARIRGLGPNPVRPRDGFTAHEVVVREMGDLAMPDDSPTPPQAHDRDLRGGRTLKMITAERKPFDEIYAMTEGHDKVPGGRVRHVRRSLPDRRRKGGRDPRRRAAHQGQSRTVATCRSSTPPPSASASGSTSTPSAPRSKSTRSC